MIGNDHWTIEIERLGMRPAGDELARRALACRPPYAICLQGKWGSGKTSLMRYAMAKLGGSPLRTTLATENEPLGELPEDVQSAWKSLTDQADDFVGEAMKALIREEERADAATLVVPIWFNPWQHQRAELPVIGLLQEIRAQFTTFTKLRNKAQGLAGPALEAGFALLGDLAASLAALGAFSLDRTATHFSEANTARKQRDFETIHEAQRLNLLFEQAVRRLLGISDLKLPWGLRDEYRVVPKRIVVFIDDLDRCAEEQTVHLLEAIKLYLQTSYCVFVVGMDGSAARRAVAKVLGQGQEVAREYLDKLFQATLHVPLPSRGAPYLLDLFEYCGIAASPEEMTQLSRWVLELIEPNPRKLKTFISSLAADWCLADGAARDFRPHLLMAYLRSVHPDVYRLLAYDPSQAKRLHRVQEQLAQPDANPVDHFLQREFRHAFEHISEKEEVRSLVVSELVERLDHLKGDQAFLRLWRDWAGNMNGGEVAEALRPLLRREAA